MTSPKEEHEVPVLSPEVAKDTQDGIFKIELPKVVDYKFPMDGRVIPSLQFKCQSLYAKRPNEICKCNSVIKTIIGKGTGDQTEIIECGKCRTSYLIRSHYNEDGTLEIKTSVWDIGRNAKRFCSTKRDKDYNFWVEFN
jgi:hypothetical protein